jgi:hypothetical protein
MDRNTENMPQKAGRYEFYGKMEALVGSLLLMSKKATQ